MKDVVGLRAKTYSYLTDDNDKSRKTNQLENKIIHLIVNTIDAKSQKIPKNL